MQSDSLMVDLEKQHIWTTKFYFKLRKMALERHAILKKLYNKSAMGRTQPF
jgi:hypothetical protein